MEFMDEKNNYTAVDKKVIGFVERRRRRLANNGFTDKKEDADKTKNILLTLPEGKCRLVYKDTVIDTTLTRGFRPINILENMKFQMSLKIESPKYQFFKEFWDIVN